MVEAAKIHKKIATIKKKLATSRPLLKIPEISKSLILKISSTRNPRNS